LEQTRDRLGEAGPEHLRLRLDQATADLGLVERLEDFRLKCSTLVKDKVTVHPAESSDGAGRPSRWATNASYR
jgi:hypothetical protein